MQHIWVKVQFRGPELYMKKGTPFEEESYLPRIFRSSSLNLHTFHLIHIVFWWQIFFRKHGKSTPNDRQDHHVLVVYIVLMTSQCRCTRALSQSHVTKHDNHMPVVKFFLKQCPPFLIKLGSPKLHFYQTHYSLAIQDRIRVYLPKDKMQHMCTCTSTFFSQGFFGVFLRKG